MFDQFISLLYWFTHSIIHNYLCFCCNVCQLAKIKAELAKAGQPGGFAVLDQDGKLPHEDLSGGYDKISAYDLGWQSLHMSAAAACRGSTPSGGTGCCENVVLVRNTAEKKTCRELCSQTPYTNCDAEVSLYGKEGKASQNGEMVGSFYNYKCDFGTHGGSEATRPEEAIFGVTWYYSFCCCRK